MHRDQAAYDAAAALNSNCRCLQVEVPALRSAIERRLAELGLPVELAASHPYLFSQVPVFLGDAHAQRMAQVVRAVEAVVALPAYQEAALGWAPEIARHDSGARGAFLGFDFHLTDTGPKLIEINTNAGGGLLAAMLGDAALSCCGASVQPVHPWVPFDVQAVRMLLAEWRSASRGGRPEAIAIIDDAPAGQYLYPEFLLMQSALRRAGIAAVIASPGDLRIAGGTLYAGEQRVDMVYNRLTDFALSDPVNQPLCEAYLGGHAVVTPNPRAHALYADKRALSLMGDAPWLRAAGLDPVLADLLGEAVPATALVSADDGERLWQARRKLFFKPFAGYGSRGAYRGDKLTHRVFEDILRGGYVAQALVPPGERSTIVDGAPLKYDVRDYAYGGEVQLLAARLWQGQTTNFRSAGGGFAPVLVLP